MYNESDRKRYMERKFRPGEIVRHFKRELSDPQSTEYLYRIICSAENSETGEQMIVYQALYGSKRIYVRPRDMFMSETDHDKYPGIRQKYRFEQADKEEITICCL